MYTEFSLMGFIFLCRNLSGIYTADFPDWPPSMYNFTGDDLPDSVDMTYQGTKVKVLNYNETVEIVFQGTNVLKGSVNHPMHMHGHSFYVVGIGHGNFNNQTDPETYNLIDPPHVNTFSVPKNGWLAIRFTANNPGMHIFFFLSRLFLLFDPLLSRKGTKHNRFAFMNTMIWPILKQGCGFGIVIWTDT